MSSDNYDDLASFDGDYEARNPFSQNLDTLSDGVYDFEFVHAELTRTKNTGDRLLRTLLKVNGGRSVEKVWFLKSQDNMNVLGADLCTLGFDADKWGRQGGPSIAQALPAAVAKLVGIKFRGTKKTREEKDREGRPTGKIYHDLFIDARVTGKPMPSSAPPFNEFAPPPGNNQTATVGAGSSSGSVPW